MISGFLLLDTYNGSKEKVMITYNGNNADFRTEVTEFNHAFRLFCRAGQNVNIRTKVRAAPNIVARLASILRNEREPSVHTWMQEVVPITHEGHNLQLCINKRQLLRSMLLVKHVIDSDEFRQINPLLRGQLLDDLNGLIDPYRNLIRNQEILLNQSLPHSLFEKMTVFSAYAFILGIATTGVGLVGYGVGSAVCVTGNATGYCTIAAGGAKAAAAGGMVAKTGGIAAGGGLLGGGCAIVGCALTTPEVNVDYLEDIMNFMP